MTAQVSDKFIYKNNEYSIVAETTPVEFHPEDYGIIPCPIDTACWAGYWCNYEITGDELILKNLIINSKNDEYPDIEGVSPNEPSIVKNMGYHIYNNINLRMSYTGKVLLGDEFMSSYYIHMGYQRAWSYKVLKEFVFQNGKLIEIIDHSDIAAKIRKEIDKDPEFFSKLSENIIDFISTSFSLDYSDKAWWLKEN